MQLRLARGQSDIIKRNFTVIYTESTYKVVQHKTTLLHKTERSDITTHRHIARRSLDIEVINSRIDVADIDVVIVPTSLTLATTILRNSKVDTIDLHFIYLQVKSSLLLPLSINDFVCNLLDVDYIALGISQIEAHTLNSSTVYRKRISYSRQRTNLRHNGRGIEQRIAIHILDIEATHLDMVKHTDSDMVNANLCTQPLRYKCSCITHRAILHIRNREH